MFHKSEALRRLSLELLILGLFTAGLTYVEQQVLHRSDIFQDTITVHSLIGFVLGLLLVFRTNTAYDRWWEGRKKWGALVNDSRNFALKLNALLPRDDKATRTYFSHMISNYVHAMKEHLRHGVKHEELEDVENIKARVSGKDHVPNYIVGDMFRKAKKLNGEGVISNEEFLIIDKELKGFTDIIGACERIKNTPIPFSYSLFIKKVIFFYIITLPIGFIPVFGYWTVPIACFIFYLMAGLEVIAEEIEDPFGLDANDLPTDELAGKIKANVHEILLEE